MKRETIVKLVKHFFKRDQTEAETLADLFIRSDFPLNGIKTMGGVIGYFEHVRGLIKPLNS